MRGKRKRKTRVMAYVDGYNLYFGLKDKNWRRFYWLDPSALCNGLLQPDQELLVTKYFTARIAKPEAKRRRQAVFCEALENAAGVHVIYGRYKAVSFPCPSCDQMIHRQSEKRSDVSIAVEMMADAYNQQFDVALLVSGDTDFCPLVQSILRRDQGKRIVVCFPPARHNKELADVASAYLTIGRARLSNSQFPDEITKDDGYILRRPKEWTQSRQDTIEKKTERDRRLKGGLQ